MTTPDAPENPERPTDQDASEAVPASCACAPGGCAPSGAGPAGDPGSRRVRLLAALAVAVCAIGVPLALKHRTGAPVASRLSAQEPAAAAAQVGATAARKLPRLIDLGTTTCAPCKAMLGVMDELERSYTDDLAVEFINVQEQQGAVERYGVQIIPTQLFLAADGRELYRHTGFLSAEAIVGKWRELGYALPPKPRGG